MRVVDILLLHFNQLSCQLSLFVSVVLQVKINATCDQYHETYHEEDELKLENGSQNHFDESHD